MIATTNKPFGIIIILMILFSICSFSINCIAPTVVSHNHPQPTIWDYENKKNQPDNALLLSLEKDQWQAIAAACIAPVFYDRKNSVPLLFDDGSEERSIQIPHDSKSVSDFGSDARSATANITSAYWTKAEIIVVAKTYEQVLWSIPIASFLSAPILIDPGKTTLSSLKTKCAIVIGNLEIKTEEVIKLESKEDVWMFQLELFDTKGQICNYVVITNPHDSDDPLNPNIEYPYLSLSAAPLAAYRKAIVQTNDYTGDKEILDEIHKKPFKDDQLYGQVKPFFAKVKSDSYTVEKFLVDQGHLPEFVALVGGPFALPDYYYDIHTQYLYWNQEVHYVPSQSPYASLKEIVPNNLTIEEDLGVGRIVGHSLLDATNQLARTFFYKEFLTGGKYSSTLPINWEKNAAVVDGHRLNQPRNGGPPHTSSSQPFHPAGEIETEFISHNLTTDYLVPKNKTNPFDTNPSKTELLISIQNNSMIQFVAHGGSMAGPGIMWMEGGYDLAGEEEKNKHKVYASDILNLSLAPGCIYVIACHNGHIFLNMDKYELLPLAYIHSGAVCYIAPVTCQSICFWENAPEGVAATQAMYFWQNILESNTAVGTALAEAKYSAYNDWKIDDDPREEPDCPAFHLFGDPAFEPFKPEVPFDSNKDMDLHVSYPEVKAGEKLEINVEVTDLGTTQSIPDAVVTITFNGKSSTGYTASFDVPDEEGEYGIEISVDKDDYQELTAKYNTFVEKGEEEDNTLIILGVIILIIVVIAMVIIAKSKKK
jgi:hypothetical protein